MELGKQQKDANRNDTSEHSVRSKVGTLSVVADEVVVVMIIRESGKERRASHDRL
jgi:hypothetical protein